MRENRIYSVYGERYFSIRPLWSLPSPLLSSPDLNNNMSDKVPNKSLMRYEKKSQQMPAQSVLTFNNQTMIKYWVARRKTIVKVMTIMHTEWTKYPTGKQARSSLISPFPCIRWLSRRAQPLQWIVFPNWNLEIFSISCLGLHLQPGRLPVITFPLLEFHYWTLDIVPFVGPQVVQSPDITDISSWKGSIYREDTVWSVRSA